MGEDDHDENLVHPGAKSGGSSRPSNGNDNDNGQDEEDTQGSEKGTRKEKGTKDWKRKGMENGKGKGKASEEGTGKGKGNRKGIGIVEQTPAGDNISRAIVLRSQSATY